MMKKFTKTLGPIGCLFMVLMLIIFVPSEKSGFDRITQSVVKVEVESNHWDSWQGTGVFIQDDLILTAGHIVEDANEIWITWPTGKKHKAVSWYQEAEADLGFIYIKTPEKEKQIDFDKAIVGEDVWLFGNPFGVFPVLTKGIVSAIGMPDDYTGQKKMVISDAATEPGNSGCPLFDKDGNILGICSWGYTYAQGMNYFVRAEICELSLVKYLVITALENAE